MAYICCEKELENYIYNKVNNVIFLILFFFFIAFNLSIPNIINVIIFIVIK